MRNREDGSDVKGITRSGHVYNSPTLAEGQERKINEPLLVDEEEGKKDKEKKAPLGTTPLD